MSGTKIPIVILAGSDRRPGDLPSTVRDKHPLSGYKGVDVHIGGRTLIEVLIERLERSERFLPIYVAGPSSVLRPVRGRGKLIDCDGTFGKNVQASIETVHADHPNRPMAFITCDVLPEVETLVTLLEDYDSETPCDLWFPLIHAPEDRGSLGASAWKPAYHIVPNEGQPAVGILPGHLLIVDPAALRLKFLYRLAQLAYRTRNRPIDYRRGVMVRGVVLELLYQDLWHLLTLRAPTLTWTVLSVGISTARELREGRITRARLEYALRRILVTSRHRRRHPERRGRLPIVEGLSLALDIDTEEEARAAGGNFATRSR
jgi:hypothetical protein